MTHRPSLTRSAILLTVVGLISQSLTFLYHIAVARLVGAQAMGLVHLIMPAYAVMQSICISGLAMAVTVLSSELYARKNTLALRQMIRVSFRGLILLWFPVALLVLTQSDTIAQRVLGDGRTRAGLLLLLPALLLTGVEHLQKQYCYGTGRLWLPASAEVVEQLARCIAIILLLQVVRPKEDTIAAALITAGILCSEVVSSLSLSLGLCRKKPTLGGCLLPSNQLRRRIAAIALPVSFTALLGNLMEAATAMAIPKLLVAYGRTPGEAMGEFGILMGMTLPMLSIPTAFVNGLTLALLPRLTEARTLGHMASFRRISEKAMLSVSYLILPSVTLIAAFGHDLGTVLFQEPKAASHIGSLAIVVCAECYHIILVCILHALDKQKESAIISLGCAGIELTATLLLTGHMGLKGFIWGQILSEAVAVPLCMLLVCQSAELRLGIGRCFVVPVLATLLAGALVVLIGQYIHRLGIDPSVMPPICICGGSLLYLVTLRAQGVRPWQLLRGK